MTPADAHGRLAGAFGALSLAADITNGFHSEKVLRTCLLAGALARAHGLDHAAVRLSWWTPLLRYLGCTAFGHEEAHLYGAGDDNSVRRAMSLADAGEPVRTAQRVWKWVAPEASFPARAAAIARLLGDGSAIAAHAAACVETAAHLSRVAGFTEEDTGHLAALEERWDGRGAPGGLVGEAIPLPTRVFQVADQAESAWQEGGPAAARALVSRRSGGWLDPALCTTFLRDADRWFAGLVGSVWERFLDDEPPPQITADEARMDAVCLAFAHFADQKSVWTLGHSPRVARVADRTAAILGLADQDRRRVRRAAWLHDLGRVAVPNRVWDKPGPLGWAEREAVREHALRTERILAATPAFRELAPIAGGAHERLDGAGYHRSLPSGLLEVAVRIVAAADVASALGEARPHRPAFPQDQVAALLVAETHGHLDPEVVRAVLMALGADERAVPAGNPRGLSDREVEVLALLARGRTNKEIAQVLGLSPKTVQHHVAHVYAKVGVTSRAVAALFASEQGLLWRAPI